MAVGLVLAELEATIAVEFQATRGGLPQTKWLGKIMVLNSVIVLAKGTILFFIYQFPS